VLEVNSSSVADVLDALGRYGTLSSRLSRLTGREGLVVGQAYTVHWAPVRKTGRILEPQPSTWRQVRDFLVPELTDGRGKVYVAGAGPLCTEAALAGGLSSTYFEELGFEAIVLGGAVRDVDALRSLRIPVVATNFIPTDTQGSYRVLETGTSCIIDNVVVHTGDWVVSDGTGTVVVPAAVFDEVVQRVRDIDRTEAAILERIRRKERLPDIIDQIGRI
jgi:regulator of RNase E activity RraA